MLGPLSVSCLDGCCLYTDECILVYVPTCHIISFQPQLSLASVNIILSKEGPPSNGVRSLGGFTNVTQAEGLPVAKGWSYSYMLHAFTPRFVEGGKVRRGKLPIVMSWRDGVALRGQCTRLRRRRTIENS